MKMAIKVGFMLGIVLLICAWALEVGAQERRGDQSRQLQEVLGLTDAQIAALRTEQEAAEAQMHELREQVQRFEEQIYLAAEQTGDPTTVGKLVLQKIALQKQIQAEQAAFRERTNSVLTPEQKDKLKQLTEAEQLSRGWDAMLLGRRQERQQRNAGVPGGGSPRPHRTRPPKQ